MNLRQLFFLTTLAAAAAFFMRRPLIAVWDYPDALYWIGQPWQHWAWLAGVDVEYRDPKLLPKVPQLFCVTWWIVSFSLQITMLFAAGILLCNWYKALGASRANIRELPMPGWRH